MLLYVTQTFQKRSYVICDSANAQRRPTVKQNRLLLISHHINVLKRRRYFQTTYKEDEEKKTNLKERNHFKWFLQQQFFITRRLSRTLSLKYLTKSTRNYTRPSKK